MHHSKIYDSILFSRRQSHFLRPWRQADFCRFPHLCPGNRHNLRFTIIVPAEAVYKTYPHYPQDFPQPLRPTPGILGEEPGVLWKIEKRLQRFILQNSLHNKIFGHFFASNGGNPANEKNFFSAYFTKITRCSGGRREGGSDGPYGRAGASGRGRCRDKFPRRTAPRGKGKNQWSQMNRTTSGKLSEPSRSNGRRTTAGLGNGVVFESNFAQKY